ncbi:MAG: hypothetical protein KatS3mg109_2036 [Pirellulaceae bacterium]|nr:MAG: hypothetical protein KatS3mg109_2036 [Pirellulaceae bacterium]
MRRSQTTNKRARGDANALVLLDILHGVSMELARLRCVRGPGWRTQRRQRRALAVAAGVAGLLGFGPLAARPATAIAPHFYYFYLSKGYLTLGVDALGIQLVDIDGDGDLDAFVSAQSGDVIIYLQNTGSSSALAFAGPVTNPFGLQGVAGYVSPAFVDIDGDGDLDAFVGGGYGNIIYFQNTGSSSAPRFAGPVTNPFGLQDVGHASSPEFVDIDGDGDLDALVGERYGNIIYFQNTGSSSAPAFGGPVTNPFGLQDVGYRSSPEFVDIDGDGDLDALVGAWDGNIIYFENTGSSSAPAFGAPQTNPFGLQDVEDRSSPEFVDIDGDGDLDAFVVQGSGGIIYRQNIGSKSLPRFASRGLVTNPFGLRDLGSFSIAEFVDIDADGDLDAFVGERSGNIIYFQNTGSSSAPGFAGPVTNPFGLQDVGSFSSPEFVDIDGDGDLDAFVGEGYGNIIYFQNTGSSSAPAFGGPVTNPFGLQGMGGYANPAFVDIDGDGDLDAFVGYGSITIYFQNTGSSSAPAFAGPVTNPFGLQPIGGDTRPAFVDIDGDGDLDAFVGYGNIIYYQNTGSSSAPAFAGPVRNPFGLHVSYGRSPAFVDIDGDGDLDAFVMEGLDGDVVHYFQNVGPACPAVACPPAPLLSCDLPPARAVLVMKDNNDDAKDLFQLGLYSNATERLGSDLGEPLTRSTYTVCVWQGSTLIAQLQAPPGQNWSFVSNRHYKYEGYVYSDKTGANDGLGRFKVLGGRTTPRATKVIVKGKGANLPDPTLPLLTPMSVTVQVINCETGICVGQTFTEAEVKKNAANAANTVRIFKAAKRR